MGPAQADDQVEPQQRSLRRILIGFGVVPVMTIPTIAALGKVPEELRLCAPTPFCRGVSATFLARGHCT
jgi:hypothetical protein